jgi:hypothetical protein
MILALELIEIGLVCVNLLLTIWCLVTIKRKLSDTKPFMIPKPVAFSSGIKPGKKCRIRHGGDKYEAELEERQNR